MRASTRFGEELVDALNVLTAFLPGSKITYYGEEIGMKNAFVPWSQTQDPAALMLGPNRYLEATRDPQRTPMQWNDNDNAGNYGVLSKSE